MNNSYWKFAFAFIVSGIIVLFKISQPVQPYYIIEGIYHNIENDTLVLYNCRTQYVNNEIKILDTLLTFSISEEHAEMIKKELKDNSLIKIWVALVNITTDRGLHSSVESYEYKLSVDKKILWDHNAFEGIDGCLIVFGIGLIFVFLALRERWKNKNNINDDEDKKI